MTGHLIHIGYPKTGSNFLRRWFASHPQIAYAEGGIAGFHSVYEVAREGAAPREGVLHRVTSCEGLATPHMDVGSPVETYDRERWSRFPEAQAAVCGILAELFPSARVLLVTRGFRSMLVSSYSQLVRTGGQLDFGDYCAEVGAAVARGDNPWDYDHLVGIYRSAFGDSNVITLPYELLRDDSRAFTHELERRLAIRPFEGASDRVNASLSPEEIRWYPRLARAVSALPLGARLRRRVTASFVRGAAVGRFRGPVRVLERLRPSVGTSGPGELDELVRAFRGKADLLRSVAEYAPYAADYLLD